MLSLSRNALNQQNREQLITEQSRKLTKNAKPQRGNWRLFASFNKLSELQAYVRMSSKGTTCNIWQIFTSLKQLFANLSELQS